MSRTVLIVVDIAERELFGCSLLSRYLAEMGLRPILCGRFAFTDYYARHAPDAVVWPNAFPDFSHVAETSHVFVLPSESGNGQPDQVRATHGGTFTNPIHPESIDRFFCWGAAMREVLLETGRWRSDQLVVTGSPSTDHWLLPLPSGTRPARIGLTTTFRALSNSAAPAKMNYFEWIDQAERSGGDGTYYVPPEHAESWVFFEASLARVIVGLVRTLAERRGEPLQIRPHPGERDSRYAYFRALGNGRVSVTKRGTISEWLEDISILFTFMSASALDAVVRGIPVVSLKGLLDPDALRKIPRHYGYCYDETLWQMERVEQAAEYVDAAVRGDLPPCRDERRFRSFVEEHYAFQRRGPAAQLIARDIKRVVDGEGGRRIRQARRRSRGGRTPVVHLVRRMPLFAQTRALWTYLNGLRPERQDIGFSYHPWRLSARRMAMRSADRVRGSVDRQDVVLS